MSLSRPPPPRSPVLGWASARGARSASLPCLLDRPGAIVTTSGRASILLALESLGLGAGDAVLVPTYHCPTMVSPIVAAGATPVFYPIDDMGAPRLDWLERTDTRDARAIIAAHLFGMTLDMAPLRQWCDLRRIALVEDCAHALFGRAGDRPVGAWGDVAIGSLPKFLPVPEGGCLVINGGSRALRLKKAPVTSGLKAMADALETATRHRRLPGLNGLVRSVLAMARRFRRSPATPPSRSSAGTPQRGDFTMDVVRAHRAPPGWVQGLAVRLPRERGVALRRQRYARFVERFSGWPGLRPLKPALPDECAPYVFPLWVDTPDPVYAELRRHGVPVFRWDWRWPEVPDDLPGDAGPQWAHHVLQLACHQDLSEADLEWMADTVTELVARPPAR